MKTTIFTLIFITLCTSAFGQTNVNEKGNKSFAIKTKDIDVLKKDLTKEEKALSVLKKELKELDQDKESNTAVVNTKKSVIASKELEVEKIKTDLETEKDKNLSRKHFKDFFENKIKTEKTTISELETELSEAAGKGDVKAMERIERKKKDSQDSISKYLKQKKVRLALFDGNYSAILPTKNELYRQQFFQSMYNKGSDKTTFINSFSLSANDDGALVQSEVITDNLGMFRIAFGSVVSSSSETPTDGVEAQEETEQESIKRLINGGGNFYLEVVLPLLTNNNENEGWVTWYTYANVIGASDIKGFGNNLDTSTANASGGLTSYAGVTSDNGKFNFFVQANLNYTIGSDDFYKNLGLTEEKGFLNGKFVAGITMLNTFRLSAIVSTFGSDEKLRNGSVTFGVQILPKL